MSAGYLKHVNILSDCHKFLGNLFSKQFRLPELWSKSTLNGIHTAFACGPSQFVVSQCKRIENKSNQWHKHNKHFILNDLYNIPEEAMSEKLHESYYGRLNSVVNLTFDVNRKYSKNFADNASFFSWSPINENLFNFVPTPCKGFSYVYCEQPSQISSSSKPSFDNSSHFSNLDHILLAVEDELMEDLVKFHTEKLGFDRVLISRNETENVGMKVEAGSGEGLRMKAMDFTKCADFSLYERSLKTKIIMADSLNPKGKDQICEFIRNNGNHSGVQHISLHTNDIVATCEDLKLRGVKFLKVPAQYYKDREWRKYVDGIGISANLLEQNNLLLDFESDSREPSYLLQVFTEPIFPNERTFFLEIIQRTGDIRGFGENNIRSLWNAVKRSNQDNDSPEMVTAY